ncbi:unnamed protein product [Vitrella brassicaformis CCMP3155]|uniref:C-type lectin domain-containing protein n=1 Tax=Vitrella brassicaformis (strain CCMP3155) TaxID=1169540 RepID=A0A0G4EZ36_VITBC|nr:unnamed protein product [Vitrella brassicaformis CCMP3155]|eukprot:CEM04572.1 unnamed protein product [Vitrella brassicaformis CCMP3155]
MAASPRHPPAPPSRRSDAADVEGEAVKSRYGRRHIARAGVIAFTLALSSLAVLVQHAAAFPSTYCESGWLWHEGRCFRKNKSQKSWEEAAEMCRSVEATLASIRSPEDNAVMSLVCGRNSRHSCWIGLNDRSEEGIFEWEGKNTPFDYTNWALHSRQDREPNNWPRPKGCDQASKPDCSADCVYLKGSDGTFRDYFCEYPLPFICEKKAQVTMGSRYWQLTGKPGVNTTLNVAEIELYSDTNCSTQIKFTPEESRIVTSLDRTNSTSDPEHATADGEDAQDPLADPEANEQSLQKYNSLIDSETGTNLDIKCEPVTLPSWLSQHDGDSDSAPAADNDTNVRRALQYSDAEDAYGSDTATADEADDDTDYDPMNVTVREEDSCSPWVRFEFQSPVDVRCVKVYQPHLHVNSTSADAMQLEDASQIPLQFAKFDLFPPRWAGHTFNASTANEWTVLEIPEVVRFQEFREKVDTTFDLMIGVDGLHAERTNPTARLKLVRRLFNTLPMFCGNAYDDPMAEGVGVDTPPEPYLYEESVPVDEDGNVDFDDLSAPLQTVYKQVWTGVSVSRPGAYEVCHCWERCQDPRQWSDVGDLVISGVRKEQYFNITANRIFGMGLRGWGLPPSGNGMSSRLKVIKGEDCGTDLPWEAMEGLDCDTEDPLGCEKEPAVWSISVQAWTNLTIDTSKEQNATVCHCLEKCDTPSSWRNVGVISAGVHDPSCDEKCDIGDCIRFPFPGPDNYHCECLPESKDPQCKEIFSFPPPPGTPVDEDGSSDSGEDDEGGDESDEGPSAGGPGAPPPPGAGRPHPGDILKPPPELQDVDPEDDKDYEKAKEILSDHLDDNDEGEELEQDMTVDQKTRPDQAKKNLHNNKQKDKPEVAGGVPHLKTSGGGKSTDGHSKGDKGGKGGDGLMIAGIVISLVVFASFIGACVMRYLCCKDGARGYCMIRQPMARQEGSPSSLSTSSSRLPSRLP